jgi:hypothetical protein
MDGSLWHSASFPCGAEVGTLSEAQLGPAACDPLFCTTDVADPGESSATVRALSEDQYGAYRIVAELGFFLLLAVIASKAVEVLTQDVRKSSSRWWQN